MSDQFSAKTKATHSQSFQHDLAFEHFPGTALGFDSDMRCVRYNRPLGPNFTGLDPEFLMGRSLMELILPEEKKKRILASVSTTLESGITTNIISEPEIGVDLPGVYTVVIPVNSEQDEELSLLTFSMETELQLSLWKHSLGNISDHVMVLDQHGEILFMNKDYLGSSSGNALGTSVFDYFEGDEQYILKASLLRVIEDDMPLVFENYVSSGRTPKWYSNSISPFVMEDGGKAAIMVSREISGIKNRVWELSEANKMHDAVVDSIGDSVISVSLSGRIVLQNSAAVSLFGIELFNLDELEDHWMRLLLPDAVGAGERGPEIRKAMSGEVFKDCSCLMKKDDGQIMHLDYSIKPLRGGMKEIIGVLLVMRDTTVSHFAREQLVKANQNMDSFVHATAHDLKSPIHNMKNLFALMDRLDSEEKKAILLEKVRQSVDKLDDFLAALMEMVDSRNIDESTVERLDIEAAFSLVCENLSDEILETKAEIMSDFKQGQHITYIKAHLLSILQNMISNAIKYRNPDRPLEIQVRTSIQGESVLLEVQDNGIGIDLERHGEEIFKPFKRLKSSAPGKGIGLNLVKNFVERNGGSVRVESTKGEGTTFKVTMNSYPEIN